MATGENAQLEFGRELPYLDMKDTYLGSILRRIINAVNQTASSASVSPVGKVTPPPKIDSIQVQGSLNNTTNVLTCPSEILHWTMTHNQTLSKGVKYFTEVDTTPQFTQPHVIDHGTGRTGFLHLPTYSSTANATNSQPTTYYMRSYAQYPGSDPCEPKVLGNFSGATQVVMTGTSVTALLSSTGSGTASTSGQQGGKGLGTVQQRPKPQTKRSVA